MPKKLPDLRPFILANFSPEVRLVIYLKHHPLLHKNEVGDVHDSQGRKVAIPDAPNPNIGFDVVAKMLGTSEQAVNQAYQRFLMLTQLELYHADSPPTSTLEACVRIPLTRSEHCVAECSRNFDARLRDGFWDRYVRPGPFVDIGYSGGHPQAQPVFTEAIGLDMNTPGYNGRDLPYHDNSIGTVHGSHLMEHIADYQYFLREVFRVLMPGGTLIIMVPLMEAYENRLVGPSIHNPDHKRFYTASRLCQELEWSLPRKCYRIIHVQENFNMDDIGRPQDTHANGPSYELVFVVEKTRPGAKY